MNYLSCPGCGHLIFSYEHICPICGYTDVYAISDEDTVTDIDGRFYYENGKLSDDDFERYAEE